MWACGIVLYELLTLGSHPFMTSKEMHSDKFNKDFYSNKFKEIKKTNIKD
jgi:hypothetical protein